MAILYAIHVAIEAVMDIVIITETKRAGNHHTGDYENSTLYPPPSSETSPLRFIKSMCCITALRWHDPYISNQLRSGFSLQLVFPIKNTLVKRIVYPETTLVL
jgi:hypothetical protein